MLVRVIDEIDAGFMESIVAKSNEQQVEYVLKRLVDALPASLHQSIRFGRDVPGLDKLGSADFATIVNTKIFDYYMIVHSSLFINEESYLYIDNQLIYTRHRMNTIRPKDVVDKLFECTRVFNELNMTKKEKAILIVLIFTMSGRYINLLIKLFCYIFYENFINLSFKDVDVVDREKLKDLNEHYTRSILYEFDLNNRDVDFYIKLKKVKKYISNLKRIQNS